MKILIIEDETRAANRIIRLLKEIQNDVEITAVIETVKEAILYLSDNKPDLIISDIQLADGLSFEIYKEITPTCPIIFTTAYDQFAIKAFETNGIDYLLKPIEKERLEKALNKIEGLKPTIDLNQLLALANDAKPSNYKSRFMIKVGDKIKTISTNDISVFYSMDKGTFLHTKSNRNYVLEYSLEHLQNKIDPSVFFKINRKYIISIDAPTEIIAHTNSRLKIKIEGFENESIIVAREKVKEFKKWLDQ